MAAPSGHYAEAVLARYEKQLQAAAAERKALLFVIALLLFIILMQTFRAPKDCQQ